MLNECPILYYSDSNTDHSADWEDSTLGMAWAAVGFAEWQQHLVLPGYEDRVLLLPKGVAPSGSATPFSRLDAVSTLVPSCSQPRLSVTS